MAAFRCADFTSPSTLLPSYSTGKRISSKVIRCSSSVSIPLSSKLSKRKNYLRPKILRTLNPKPQETVSTGIDSPEIVPPSDVLSNQDDVVEELQVVSSSSAVPNEMSGILSKLSPKSIAKYGLFLIGLFAFQTVCAVLFLGNSTKSGKTPENSSENVDSGNPNRSVSLNLNLQTGGRTSNVVSLEDLEMNEKIAEIRAMAREARRSEAKSGKKEEDETLNPGGGIDIEKEIEARLSNMEKRLNSQRKGLAGLRVEPSDESRDDDLKDEKSLMFEKKYKFKAEKPAKGNVKGFGGSKGNNETWRNGSVGESRDGEKDPEEEEQEEAGPSDSKKISGAAQESEQRRPSNKVNKSRKSGNQVGRKPNMEAGSGFGRTSFSGQHGEVRKGNSMRRAGEKQSGKENNVWWLKLPYVLRILMRSNIDQEISEGYFTIRTESMEQNEGQVSHMIAFEDQSDAVNFSYLLESVFEDLDDFSANVAPISTKDLHNEVSSGDKNVIVVKKRQLTLYAGQPFEDVERALHTLIQEQTMKE